MKIPKYKVKKLISESLKKIIIENENKDDKVFLENLNAFKQRGKSTIGGVIVMLILYMKCEEIKVKVDKNSIDLENDLIKVMVSNNLKPKLDYGIDFCNAKGLSKLIAMLLDPTPRITYPEGEKLLFTLLEDVGDKVLDIVGKTDEEMALYVDRDSKYAGFKEEGWKEIFDKINNKDAQQQIYNLLN